MNLTFRQKDSSINGTGKLFHYFRKSPEVLNQNIIQMGKIFECKGETVRKYG